LWVAGWLVLTWYLQRISDGTAPKPGQPPTLIFAALGRLFERSIANVTVYGFLPVVPMVLGSALLMIFVSLITTPPSQETIAKYFEIESAAAASPSPVLQPATLTQGRLRPSV
jgi:hypothetical protein